MCNTTALLLVLTLLVPGAAAAEMKWKKYPNERFGFVLSYPGTLIASRDPANGAGREFHSPDGEFSIVAQAHFLTLDDGDSLDTRWKEELRSLGDTVTYKKKAAAWYVVSGVTKEDTEYYTKFFTKGSNWAEFRITYPHAKRKNYDPWVEQIARTFVPFTAGDFDRIP